MLERTTTISPFIAVTSKLGGIKLYTRVSAWRKPSNINKSAHAKRVNEKQMMEESNEAHRGGTGRSWLITEGNRIQYRTQAVKISDWPRQSACALRAHARTTLMRRPPPHRTPTASEPVAMYEENNTHHLYPPAICSSFLMKIDLPNFGKRTAKHRRIHYVSYELER